MTEQVMTYNEDMGQEKPLQRWVKRIWNVVPSRKAVWGAIKYCAKNFLKKTRNAIIEDVKNIGSFVKRCCKTLGAFSTYNIQTPLAKATDCPLDEMPLIVKIESIGGKGRHFHGGMAYNDVAIDSNGAGQNAPKDGKMEAPVDTQGSYFVLYPSKLGLDKEKLLSAMKVEAGKTNDYDFWIDNCIDHVIRPLKAAGADIDFGEVSTPKELCKWCDNACVNKNAGFVLNEEEYNQLLMRIEENGKVKSAESGNIDFLYIINSLRKMITKPYIPGQTKTVQNTPVEAEKTGKPTVKNLPIKDCKSY